MYLHVRILLSENKKKTGKENPRQIKSCRQKSLWHRKKASRAKYYDQWAFWCRLWWRNKWSLYHWETPRVESYDCSWDLLEPGLGDNHKLKLTDNSHLTSSGTEVMKTEAVGKEPLHKNITTLNASEQHKRCLSAWTPSDSCCLVLFLSETVETMVSK